MKMYRPGFSELLGKFNGHSNCMRRNEFRLSRRLQNSSQEPKPAAVEEDSDDSIDETFEHYRTIRRARYGEWSLPPSFKTPNRSSRRSSSSISRPERPQTPEPTDLNIYGHSIVSSSVAHVRNQKFEGFVDKPITNTTLPMDWISARASPARTPRKRIRYETNEQRAHNQLMSRDDFHTTAKTLASIEMKRKRIRDKQKIPDWAQSDGLGPVFRSKRPRNKTQVISRTLIEKDHEIV